LPQNQLWCLVIPTTCAARNPLFRYHVKDLSWPDPIHLEAIKKAVEAGAGIGCLSNLTVCRAINRGWLQQVQLEGADMSRQLYIIQHKNKAKTRLINEFLDFCFLLSQCEEGQGCLSSPEDFQDLVLQFTDENQDN
jgi:DNA-binding transcriptional LysR family regulator